MWRSILAVLLGFAGSPAMAQVPSGAPYQDLFNQIMGVTPATIPLYGSETYECTQGGVLRQCAAGGPFQTLIIGPGDNTLFATHAFIVSTFGNSNAIVGATKQDGSGGNTFVTGVTGYGNLINAGNQVFGIFGRADCNSTGVCTNEFNTFNYNAAPPSSFPPNKAFGTTQTIPNTLQIVAYGTYPSYSGAYFANATSASYGFYVEQYTEAGAADYGIFFDATTTQDTTVPILLKSTGAAGHLPISIQTTNAGTLGRASILLYDYTGATVFQVDQLGNIGGNVYSSDAIAGVTCAGSPTTSFASHNGLVTHC